VLPQPHPPGSHERSLAAYGWNDAREADFASRRAIGLVPARIAGVDRRLITGMLPGGSITVTPAPMIPTDPLHGPCTGGSGTCPGPATRARGAPRRAALVRSSASKTSHGQVPAANINQSIRADARQKITGCLPRESGQRRDTYMEP
jgi:ribosome biogenesis GTPase